MSVRQRARRKHRRAALDAEEEDENEDFGYKLQQQEQQPRRANMKPQQQPQRRSQQRVTFHDAYGYEDGDGDEDDGESESDVKTESVAYPVRSLSSSCVSKSLRKQQIVRESSSCSTSLVKKKSRRPLPLAVADSASAAVSASVNVASPRVLPVMLTIGDWLGTKHPHAADVMDYVGVWNVGQVLSIPSNHTVEVRYDGWDRGYNEVVPLNSSRVAPFHTFTWSVKCWAKYLNWPWWPAIMTVRTPGNEEGAENLRTVERVYVDFVDSKQFATRCSDETEEGQFWYFARCWVDKRDVVPFDASFENLRKKTNGAAFEFSLKHVLKSTATAKFPTFVEGTLPKQYEAGVTMPVRKMKKVMGNTMWLKDFANNRERHNWMHGCQGALLGTQDGIDEVEVILQLQEDLTRQLKERKRLSKLPPTLTRRWKPDGEATPLSASQRSPTVTPRSPRVVADNTMNVVLPENVIFHNDDIIVEDDDEREEKKAKRTKRLKQRKRSRRSRVPLSKVVRSSSDDDKSDESSSSDDEESESDEDAGPALPLPRRTTAAAREIAAKVRNDPRKKLPTKASVTTKSTTKKRPRAACSLWFRDSVQDAKREPQASSRRDAENGGASEQGNSSNDSEGDDDWGFTTEEYSEERLLDGDAGDDNYFLSPVVTAKSPISELLDPDENSVKNEIEPFTTANWTEKQEPITIDSSPEPTTKQEPVRPKSSGSAKQKATASPMVSEKSKKTPSHKRPSPPPRAKIMQTTKRKPPRSLMDTRMKQAQAAIRASEEEDRQNKQDAVSSAVERRSLGNLRRVKGAIVRTRATSLPMFPGFSPPKESSSTQQLQSFSMAEFAGESGDDGDDSQGSIPRLLDPPPINLGNGKNARSNKQRTSSLAGEKEDEEADENQERPPLKENQAVNIQKELQDEEQKGEDESDVVPQLRRRFCMMRATSRVDESRAVQQKVRAFRATTNESQMVVLAPNKFPDPLPLQQQQQQERPAATSVSEIVIPIFGASGVLSHSMLRIANPAALTPLSTVKSSCEPVFNSSAGFSIKSWFKQAMS